MSSDDLARYDETLSAEPLDLPGGAERRRELLDQRFVHGLLRAMHTADAAHREARVRAVMSRLGGAPARPVFGWVAAAAIVLVSLAAAFWFGLRDTPPRIEAMVQRAIADLSRPVDRRYAIEVSFWRGATVKARREYELTVRAPRRFLLKGPAWIGQVLVGCDGDEVWVQPAVRWLRWSKPWTPERQLGSFLADGRLEAGDIDLSGLIQKLERRAGELSVERLDNEDDKGDAADPTVRLEARDVRPVRGPRLRSLILELGEHSGVVRRIEVVQARGPRWDKRVVFEYQGTVELPEDAYRRPW